MAVTTPRPRTVVTMMRIQLMGLWMAGWGRSGVRRESHAWTWSAVCALESCQYWIRYILDRPDAIPASEVVSDRLRVGLGMRTSRGSEMEEDGSSLQSKLLASRVVSKVSSPGFSK